MTRLACSLLVTLMVARGALGDGGVPILSIQGTHGRCTLVMQPAQPVVGPVVFEVIGAGEGPVQLMMLEASASVAAPVPMSRDAVMGVWRGTTRLDSAGACRITLACGDQASATAEVFVGPAPSPWQAQWPWIFAWLAPGALLLMRQQALHRRIYTARTPHG